jgi:hypothetical protein
MGKPLILGDSSATKEYFSAGTVYTSATAADIVEKICFVMANRESLAREVSRLVADKSTAWSEGLENLEQAIEQVR